MMTDDATLQGKVTKSTTGSLLDFGLRRWNLTKRVSIESDYLCRRIQGSGYWCQVTSDDFIRLLNLKDSSIKDLCCRGKGEGFRFDTTTSSGRNTIVHAMAQGYSLGFVWEAFNGAGCDNWTLVNCHAEDCATGFKVIGSNCLSPWSFQGCTATGCDVGFDLSKGGAGASFDHCGGSQMKIGWLINGGFEHDIRNAKTEDTDVVLRIGSPEDCGQPTPFHFHAAQLTNGARIEIYKAGKVTIDVRSVIGKPLEIVCMNKSHLPLELSLPNVKGTVSNLEGKVFLDGTMVIPNK